MQRYSTFQGAMRPDAQGVYVLLEDAEKEIQALRRALRDCMTYFSADNLTMRTKERNWQAVLDGGPWNSASVEVSK